MIVMKENKMTAAMELSRVVKSCITILQDILHMQDFGMIFECLLQARFSSLISNMQIQYGSFVPWSSEDVISPVNDNVELTCVSQHV